MATQVLNYKYTSVADLTTDSVGTFDATLNNGVSAVTDVGATNSFGDTANFDGTTDYVISTLPTTLSSNTSRSVSAWIYQSFSDGSTSGKILAAAAGSGFCNLQVTTGNVINLHNSAFSITSNTVIALDTWYHITATYDVTPGDITLYIDGVLDETITASVWDLGLKDMNYIGGSNGNSYFYGNIVDFRVYDGALTAGEVSTLFGAGPDVPAVTTQGYDLLTKFIADPVGQQVTYASFHDNEDTPTKLYMFTDVHNSRDTVDLACIDLDTDTITSAGVEITTTTSGSAWNVGTNFSGCYCSYNGDIIAALPEKLVQWDGVTATVLETSDKSRWLCKVYESEPQYFYVFSDGMEIQKWDLSTTPATIVSTITQAWVPASPIRFADYLSDGTAWLMSKQGDLYKGTWDKSGNMTESTDYAILYTNAGVLDATPHYDYMPFRYSAPNDIIVITENSSAALIQIFDYDVQAGTMVVNYPDPGGSSVRWPHISIDTVRGRLHYNSLYSGHMLNYPAVYFQSPLSVTIGVLTAMASWPEVDSAVAYRLTYTPSGGSETTVISSTVDLIWTVSNLTPETAYDFSLYSSLDGIAFSLVLTVSGTTGANIAANYDITAFGATGSYDLTTLSTTSLASLSGVLTDLFATDDNISVPVNGKTVVAKFIKNGGTSTIAESPAVILPFDADNGGSQSLNFTYQNATTEAVIYAEGDNTIEIESVVYNVGDYFFIDGRKAIMREL